MERDTRPLSSISHFSEDWGLSCNPGSSVRVDRTGDGARLRDRKGSCKSAAKHAVLANLINGFYHRRVMAAAAIHWRKLAELTSLRASGPRQTPKRTPQRTTPHSCAVTSMLNHGLRRHDFSLHFIFTFVTVETAEIFHVYPFLRKQILDRVKLQKTVPCKVDLLT